MLNEQATGSTTKFTMQEQGIMKRISYTLATMAALAVFSSASFAQSSKPVSVGIAGGAAIPVGDLADDYNTGFNGTVFLNFNSVGTPLGIRIDGMYNKLGDRDDRFPPIPNVVITSANANLVYALPGTGIRPYLIGGGGIYGLKQDVSGASTKSDFGVNGGIGASFPLSGFNTFIEARLHHVFTDNYSTQFIPVTFGISF
jgi:hypothetical protein